MSTFDHYAAARELILHLELDGHATEAATLNAAMEGGATGTEILMALRFHLAEIINRASLKGDAKARALRLLVELNGALE